MMTASRPVLAAGATLLAVGLFLTIIGILYISYGGVCFGGFVCQGQGLLAIASFTLANWGIGAESIGVAILLLGAAVVDVGRKGRARLAQTSGVMAYISSILLAPAALVWIFAFGYMIFTCLLCNLLQTLEVLGFLILVPAGIMVGFAAGSYALRGIRLPWALAGLILEIFAALVSAFLVPFFVEIAVPIVVLSFFSLLFLILENTEKPRIVPR